MGHVASVQLSSGGSSVPCVLASPTLHVCIARYMNSVYIQFDRC